MTNVKIEWHCHSQYSHDCGTSIENIAKECAKIGLTHIIICDHDNYGISCKDIKVLETYGVTLIPAIEFTTKEGIHIVGIHPRIDSFKVCPGFYGTTELISILSSNAALISIPHPYHATGLLGNGGLTLSEIEYCLSNAKFVEISNYKYGEIKNVELFAKYSQLKMVIGSDAHSSQDVGAHYLDFGIPDGIDNKSYETILLNPSKYDFVFRKRHNKMYWVLKRIKKGRPYQIFLSLFPADIRRKIKNILLNR